MSALSLSFFQSTGMAYALLFVLIAFVLLFIPSLMVTGAKPEGVARAISCYMWKIVGLIILAMSVVQLASDLINGKLPDPPLLSALILLFAVGTGAMVQASRVAKSVDEASSVIVRLIFFHTCEIIGGVIALISALSVALSVLLTNNLEFANWQMPATTLLLGLTTMLAASIHIKNSSGGRAKPKVATKAPVKAKRKK